MQPTPGVFTGKLCELERQYGDAVDRLRLYQQADHEQVRRELQALWQDCRERELQMRESVRESRSPAVAALSQAQLAALVWAGVLAPAAELLPGRMATMQQTLQAETRTLNGLQVARVRTPQRRSQLSSFMALAATAVPVAEAVAERQIITGGMTFIRC